MTPFDAALQGAREIALPVIAMTITLAAVYAPIGFVSGVTGALFREFAFTLAGSVIVSGFIALTLSPMMCSRLLKTPARRRRRTLRALPRPDVRGTAPALSAPPACDAEFPRPDPAHPRRRAGPHRHHVCHDAEGTRAGGRPGLHPDARQDAAIRQSRLPGEYDERPAKDHGFDPGEGPRLRDQRSQRPASGLRRHDPEAVGRAHPQSKADSAGAARETAGHSRRPGVRLLAAGAARLDRRTAAAIRDPHDRRFSAARPGSRRHADGGAKERPVPVHRQRPEIRHAAIGVQDRCRQGQSARHQHAGHRHLARDPARRQLCQPFQSLRPQLRSHPAGPARVPPDGRLADPLSRCARRAAISFRFRPSLPSRRRCSRTR